MTHLNSKQLKVVKKIPNNVYFIGKKQNYKKETAILSIFIKFRLCFKVNQIVFGSPCIFVCGQNGGDDMAIMCCEGIPDISVHVIYFNIVDTNEEEKKTKYTYVCVCVCVGDEEAEKRKRIRTYQTDERYVFDQKEGDKSPVCYILMVDFLGDHKHTQRRYRRHKAPPTAYLFQHGITSSDKRNYFNNLLYTDFYVNKNINHQIIIDRYSEFLNVLPT